MMQKDVGCICAIMMLLQKKGADIRTQRSSKRLKSVKLLCTGCNSYIVSARQEES